MRSSRGQSWRMWMWSGRSKNLGIPRPSTRGHYGQTGFVKEGRSSRQTRLRVGRSSMHCARGRRGEKDGKVGRLLFGTVAGQDERGYQAWMYGPGQRRLLGRAEVMGDEVRLVKGHQNRRTDRPRSLRCPPLVFARHAPRTSGRCPDCWPSLAHAIP